MFSFFRKKVAPPAADEVVAPAQAQAPAPAATPVVAPAPETPAEGSGLAAKFASIRNWFGGGDEEVAAPPVTPPVAPPVTPPVAIPAPAPVAPPPSVTSLIRTPVQVPVQMPVQPPHRPAAPDVATPAPAAQSTPPATVAPPAPTVAPPEPAPPAVPERRRWLDKLSAGLRKTGSSIAQVFTGTQIDDGLYEELESALLMADAGVKATAYLLDDLKRRVKESRAADPQAVRSLLVAALADLLKPLEAGLVIGEHTPTVIMVVGVNGAGKTTSIGKLTRHLAEHGETVLLAAADTFRAAAKEQLAVWAGRNNVEIVSQEGGDPSAVTFDAVVAGAARGRDVVIADTAGRLPTQIHLMDELKKIKRTIGKARDGAPHEVLLVVDGNTGQNALSQVKSFDEALGLTGLVITKLDGTAKGGVLAAIALWSRERARVSAAHRPLPVYFVGVGEKLEDLETFDAREFALALLT